MKKNRVIEISEYDWYHDKCINPHYTDLNKFILVNDGFTDSELKNLKKLSINSIINIGTHCGLCKI